jgi:exo-beta-1,3-glucanase (GH17 family)
LLRQRTAPNDNNQEGALMHGKLIKFWLVIGLVLSAASLISIPASSVISLSGRGAQGLAISISPPASCSQPVDDQWIGKVSRIRWVDYSSPNPHPDGGYYQPMPESIYQDLLTLKKASFTGLITYGSAGIMGKQFLAIAQTLGYQGVIMGIWNPNAQDELNNAINAAGMPLVLGYGIGNEGLSGPRDRYTVTELCSSISRLRISTGKPAATSEDIEAYYRQPELLSIGDWLFPISHPYWHFTKYALDAIQWEKDQYAALRLRTDRYIFFKEVGLPTAGAYGLSEANQELYYRGLADTEVPFAYFEGFDQPTKTQASVEPHWGIFHSDLEPKLIAWDLMGYRLFTPEINSANFMQECSKSNGASCSMDATGTTFLVGRGLQGRQYSASLSFNTSGLPDGVVITSVKLKIRSAGVAGRDPLNNHQNLIVDICRPPTFKTGRTQAVNARVSVNCNESVGILDKNPNSGWYTVDFLPAALQSINLSGSTLFRLRMGEVPIQDSSRAYIKFYSGEDADPNSPLLMVKYSLP